MPSHDSSIGFLFASEGEFEEVTAAVVVYGAAVNAEAVAAFRESHYGPIEPTVDGFRAERGES